jgi:hypothetical protein
MDYNIIKGKSILANTLDAYYGNLNYTINEYTDNGIYLCKISATNTTTAPTLNINSIGAKTIYTNSGLAVTIGTILINGWYLFMYDSITDGFLKLN